MISSLDGIMLHSLAFGSQQINAVQQVNLLINQLMEMLLVNFFKKWKKIHKNDPFGIYY
jgi:hypothetical protein